MKLVGRSREIRVASEALRDALGGRGRLLLLAGEPGIGKTRLADEIADAAQTTGALVLWGRCWEAGGAPVYWPWIELTRALLRALPALSRSPSVDSLAELLGDPARPPGPVPEDPAAARFRLFDAVLTTLRTAAAERPLMLVVDDVHVADLPSVRLLHFVARALRELRVLLVLTVREPEVRERPELAAAIDAIAREGERLLLSRLSRGEIGDYVRDAGLGPRDALDERTLDALVTATEGNPLCLSESVRWLSRQEASRASSATTLVPEGVRHAIAGNLERLDDGAREVLGIASVVGRHVPLDTLREVLARAGVRDVETRVASVMQEAVRMGAITLDDEESSFAFAHILVRESLYDRLTPARRAALHAHVATVLEERRPAVEVDAETLTTIAHHYARAGASGSAASIAYGLRAGRRALDALGAEEAGEHFARVLGKLDATPAPDPRLRAEALLGAAEAEVASGALAEGRRIVNEAAALARAQGDASLLARAALVLGAEIRAGAIDGTLVSLLEEALAMLPTEDSPQRARVLARLAAARQPAPDTEIPVAMAKEAIVIARRLGDRPTLAYVLHAARAAFMPRGHLAERIAIAEEALALAEAIGDRAMARTAHLRLACDRLEDRSLEESFAHIDRLEALDPTVPPRQRWRAPMLRAMLAVMQGDFARADAAVARARALVDRRDDNAETALIFHELGRMRTEQRHDDLLASARRSDGGGGGQTFRSIQQALINMYATTQARRREDAAAAYAVWRTFSMRKGVAGVTGMAEAAAFVGADEDVESFYEELVEQADTIDVWGTFSFHATGSTHRVLGLLAARLGRYEVAFDHFARAVADNVLVGAAPFVAETELAWAEALFARDGAWGDEARGRLRHARAIATALSLRGMLGRIDGMLAAVPPAATSGGTDAPDDLRRLFVEEGDVWAITWEQQTFRLKDARGLRLLVHLLERPDVEVHVLELAAIVDGLSDVPAQGSKGAALDARAKAEYRARLEELGEELREAESFADRGRVERLQREIEALTEELAGAVGLGGRDRTAGSSAERARVRVQKRLADACKRIEAQAPALARLLAKRLRTGTFCSYRPAD